MLRNCYFFVAILMALMAVQGENHLLRKRTVFHVDDETGPRPSDAAMNFWDANNRKLSSKGKGGSAKGSGKGSGKGSKGSKKKSKRSGFDLFDLSMSMSFDF